MPGRPAPFFLGRDCPPGSFSRGLCVLSVGVLLCRAVFRSSRNRLKTVACAPQPVFSFPQRAPSAPVRIEIETPPPVPVFEAGMPPVPARFEVKTPSCSGPELSRALINPPPPVPFFEAGMPPVPARFEGAPRPTPARFEGKTNVHPAPVLKAKHRPIPGSNEGTSCFFEFRLDFSEKGCTLNHSNISGRSSVWLER